MEQKIFPLQNRGMNRDGSISKADNSTAFENWNVRITARDHDTLLSVTNERGNSEISLGSQIQGTLIGWNVLNNHLILFTTNKQGSVATTTRYMASFYQGLPNNFTSMGLHFTFEGATASSVSIGTGSSLIRPDEAAQMFNEKFIAQNLPVVASTQARTTLGTTKYYIEFVFSKKLDGDVTLRGITGPDPVARSFTVTPYELPYYREGIPISGGSDFIYRIDFTDDGPVMRRGNTDSGSEIGEDGTFLYQGNLGFNPDYPIESVVYYETEEIQKIYWVDGLHVLRFMNFMESTDTMHNAWNDTYFDSNRSADLGLRVTITKDNSGNNRANGVVQYLVTYYNKHGQQTGYVWVSDLVYLSPLDSGGSPEGFNSNSVTLKFTNLDESYEYFRVYSIERSSLNGTVTGYLIAENRVSSNAVVIDNGKHLSTVDSSSLLFLGSQALVAGTMTHKDETLFLGDLSSIGKGNYDSIQDAIDTYAFEDDEHVQTPRVGDNVYISHLITFQAVTEETDTNITSNGIYPYSNQLKYTSSQITGFKGGEKYRFALMFRKDNGVNSDAFWIGDKINPIYPNSTLSETELSIHRVIAKCTVPEEIMVAASSAGFTHAVLMVAEATYSDRLVLAQGVLNPTVFNVWERYENRVYAYSSWIFRPKFSPYAWRHFAPIENSISPYGEIQCNYWTADAPTPYWREYTQADQTKGISIGDIVGTLDGFADYDVMTVTYGVRMSQDLYFVGAERFESSVDLIYVKFLGSLTQTIFERNFTGSNLPNVYKNLDPNGIKTFVDSTDSQTYQCQVTYYDIEFHKGKGTGNDSRKSAWIKLHNYIVGEQGLSENYIPDYETYRDVWTRNLDVNNTEYYNAASDIRYSELLPAQRAAQWYAHSLSTQNSDNNYYTSYHKKHVMFVDQNIVTLNSPELEQEAVNVDKGDFKLRIVGVTKVTGNISDYTLTASPAHLAGQNLFETSFTNTSVSENPDGIISWPLYLENDLIEDGGADAYVPDEIDKRNDSSYNWGSGICQYWLHMWQKGGTIQDFIDDDEQKYSELQNKRFANLRYCWNTQFLSSSVTYSPREIRHFNYTNEQLVSLKIGSDENSSEKTYSANSTISLSLPSNHKYPILQSPTGTSPYGIGYEQPDYTYKKFSNQPVTISFKSSPHAVISLGETSDGYSRLLPYSILNPTLDWDDNYHDPEPTDITPNATRGFIPWALENQDTESLNDVFVKTTQEFLELPSGVLTGDERLLYIGELYRDENPESDYGGISESALSSNKFIVASKQYDIVHASESITILGTQGDTYFQRWDCLKTVQYSEDSANSIIEVLSFPVETHINIDGRYDKQRGISLLASINAEQFNNINPVYSQDNNFFAAFDQDSDADLNSYRSSITWTLPKADAADIDEWTHITLASSLKLDGDKGICRALRRFNNTIFAFQDRGIAEVLFNSRTQIPSSEGVPIEIANSGKVDGKRYISNKYGCINKWSIVEGKAGLYFVDNTNKMFGRLDQGITDLSTKLSFNAWFRKINNMEPWNPEDFNNIVSFYDRVHSDVYLISSEDGSVGAPLVYNEILDAFTGFFDYWDVPMMTNIEDSFISFKNHKLWLQNSGLYCNFFGTQYDFSVTYRVTPDPYGDKIWTNLDYRADFFQTVTADGSTGLDYNADKLIEWDGDEYQPDMTFDSLRVWNEYQSTQNLKVADIAKDQYADTRKKFRIWRMDIPRAKAGTTINKYGLDRIRNPWIFLKLSKSMTSGNANRCLMQLHDVNVKYFE